MHRLGRMITGAVSLGAALLAPTDARASRPTYFAEFGVVGGIFEPTSLCFLADGRLLVGERPTGKIRLIVNGAFAQDNPILTIPDVKSEYGEQGLLGVAVDPAWPVRPYVYVHYDAVQGVIRISRFTATGDLAFAGNGSFVLDPASQYDLLHAPDLTLFHNGGGVRFAPDGKLYVSLGEDNDQCAAQNPAALNGKILRLEVAGLPAGPGGPAPIALIAPADNPFASHPDSAARLVWAYGLRNPFSFHVDPLNGDLFIADVGWIEWEELDWANAPGLNFGWPFWEGPLRHPVQCPGVVDTSTGFVAPMYAYQRPGTQFGASVIGGTVYRRPTGAVSPFPLQYEGDVFVSDFYQLWMRRLKKSGSAWDLAPALGQPNATDWANPYFWATDYQVGPDGALWYALYWTNFQQPDGQIRRIVYFGPQTDVPLDPASPGVSLAPPWPSPARREVRLAFRLDRPRWVRLAVYDLAGRCVDAPIRGELRGPGDHEQVWNGRAERRESLPAGVYLVRLTAEGMTLTRRLVWLH